MHYHTLYKDEQSTGSLIMLKFSNVSNHVYVFFRFYSSTNWTTNCSLSQLAVLSKSVIVLLKTKIKEGKWNQMTTKAMN